MPTHDPATQSAYETGRLTTDEVCQDLLKSAVTRGLLAKKG